MIHFPRRKMIYFPISDCFTSKNDSLNMTIP